MGTPWRSKKFHEAYFGDMGDNTLPDQVSGMKDLASRVSLDRSSTAWASTATPAAAMPPRAPCSTIPISSRWGFPNPVTTTIANTKTIGPRSGRVCWKRPADGKTNYDSQANQNFAKNLKGHLLLAHGTMDNNVPPYNTLLVVSELIKANKDFDLVLFPNRRAWLRSRLELHDAQTVGLFRPLSVGCGAAQRVRIPRSGRWRPADGAVERRKGSIDIVPAGIRAGAPDRRSERPLVDRRSRATHPAYSAAAIGPIEEASAIMRIPQHDRHGEHPALRFPVSR